MSAGLPPQHSSVASLATSSYYQQGDQPQQHSPAKYPENGHDTLSDFVTFVCQEAENTQQGTQVQCLAKYKLGVDIENYENNLRD